MSVKTVFTCDGGGYHYGEKTSSDPAKDGWFWAERDAGDRITLGTIKIAAPGNLHFCSWNCFETWLRAQLEKPQAAVSTDTAEVSH